jgi:hypothetical protein
MTAPHDVAGTAALAICESLLLALKDYKVLPDSEIAGVVNDAAAAYTSRLPGKDDARHAAVAALINGILPGRHPVSRRQGEGAGPVGRKPRTAGA